MSFFSLGFVHLVRSGWRVTRLQGLLALTCYFVVVAVAFVGSWG